MKTRWARDLQMWNTCPDQEVDNCGGNGPENYNLLFYLCFRRVSKFDQVWIQGDKFKASFIKHYREVTHSMKTQGFILVLLKLGRLTLASLFRGCLTKDSSELKLNSKLCFHGLSWEKYDLGLAVIQALWEGKPFISFSSLLLGTLYRVGTKLLQMPPKVISWACISIEILWQWGWSHW